MMAALHAAAVRGAKVVAINPLKERGFTNFSDPKEVVEMLSNTGRAVAHRIYQVRIGGDLALFKGVMKHLLALDEQARSQSLPRVIDTDFIAQHTLGFDAVVQDLAHESWDLLCEQSGLPREQIEELATLYAQSSATMATWCMGLTHHENSVATVQTLVNLLLLKGNIGKPGAGAVPVRGHSNVQGDRTMGATSKVSAAWLDQMAEVFPRATLTRRTGLDAMEYIGQLLQGRMQALLSLGGNFGAAAPDSTRVLAALSKLRLTVHIATKLNRTHCHPGEIGLLLPTLGRTDVDQRKGRPQVVTMEDSMSNVRSSRGIQAPLAATMMSEPAIVAHLGQALSPDSGVPWQHMADDYEVIRHTIERCQSGLVDGFSDYNRKVNELGRFPLANAAKARQWRTASGKAEFVSHPVPMQGPIERARAQHGEGVLSLMTVRSHDQFNTTVYGLDDRYRGVFGGREVVFMNEADLRDRGLADGDLVDIRACAEDGVHREIKGFKVVRYDIPAGCMAAYFPEATPLLSATLVSAHTRTPSYKAIPVMVSVAT
jgi:molybdopterin-dependent oxidoreductase alpha subunit